MILNKNVRYEFYLLESLDYNDETNTHFDFQEIAGPFKCAEDAFYYYMEMEPSGYANIDEWREMFKIRQVCISEFGVKEFLNESEN